MSVRIEDLSPWAQKQALQKLMEGKQKKAIVKSKYHNQKEQRTTAGGISIRFDSRKEARRFDELCAMLHAGEIRDLKLQPQFTLQEAYTTAEGVRVWAIRYQADFSYERAIRREMKTWDGQLTEWCTMEIDWVRVVEDVKSRATKTRMYEMKKKLMREKFGIEIQEV